MSHVVVTNVVRMKPIEFGVILVQKGQNEVTMGNFLKKIIFSNFL